jgi:hypothetical protein
MRRLLPVKHALERLLSARLMSGRSWPVPACQPATAKQPLTILDGSYGFRVRSIPYGL